MKKKANRNTSNKILFEQIHFCEHIRHFIYKKCINQDSRFFKCNAVVVQQQRQRNLPKGVMFFFFFANYTFYFLFYLFYFCARMAQFPCMFLIELILSTDLQKDFFAVVSSLFFVYLYKRELRCQPWISLYISVKYFD